MIHFRRRPQRTRWNQIHQEPLKSCFSLTIKHTNHWCWETNTEAFMRYPYPWQPKKQSGWSLFGDKYDLWWELLLLLFFHVSGDLMRRADGCRPRTSLNILLWQFEIYWSWRLMDISVSWAVNQCRTEKHLLGCRLRLAEPTSEPKYQVSHVGFLLHFL